MPKITTLNKWFKKRKVITKILGLFLLIGGIGAGVVLVGQSQDIRGYAAGGCKYQDGHSCNDTCSPPKAGGKTYKCKWSAKQDICAETDKECGGYVYIPPISGSPSPTPSGSGRPITCQRDCVTRTECKAGGSIVNGSCSTGEVCCDFSGGLPQPTNAPTTSPTTKPPSQSACEQRGDSWCTSKSLCDTNYGYEVLSGVGCTNAGDICCRVKPGYSWGTPRPKSTCHDVCISSNLCRELAGTKTTGDCIDPNLTCCKIFDNPFNF